MNRNPYFQTPFVLCFGILAVAAAGMNAAVKWADVQLKKYPIPLRKPLDQIDRSKLEPYQIYKESKIDNPDILESLGTTDYIQWMLEDTSAKPDSPVRYCSLFITYYTGNPDRVPHVPNECYVGGGNTREQEQVHRLNLQSGSANPSGILPAQIEVRRLVFSNPDAQAWDPDSRFSVLYFFKVNGEYADSRTGTRTVMGKNFLCKYSYFSKVEWRFSGNGTASIEEIVQASERLMSILVPLLETQHWPDWEKAKQDSASKS